MEFSLMSALPKIILIVVFLLLQTIDILLTRKILSLGGRELNPIMRGKYSIWIKAGASIIVIAGGLLTHWLVLVLPIAIMIGVCVWNYRILREMH
jgi:hypothetical protein